MAVKLRLTRMGGKNNPHYRVVAAESGKPRDGRFIEIVGHFDPKRFPESVVIDEEKVKGWLAKGAQPTEAVKKLLARKGLTKPAGA